MTRSWQAGLAVMLSLGMGSNAFAVGASGLTTQMVSAKALGQGNAFAAEADDPSAIYYNPAGITQLPGTQLYVGSALLVPYTTRTGNGVPDDHLKKDLSVLPMFYATHTMDLGDHKLSYGVGVHSPFGLTTDWGDNSSLKYVATKSAFEMIDVNPTIAYQVSPTVGIGVGADYVNLFNVTQDAQINQTGILQQAGINQTAADGLSHLSGHGEGWGYNAGVLFKPLEHHSFAVSYRSQVQIPIRGSVELSNLDPTVQALFNFAAANYSTNATSDFTLPQSVIAGYNFHPNDKWTMLLDYEWTQWNSFQSQNVAVSETDNSGGLAGTGKLGLLNSAGSGSQVISTQKNWRNVSAVGGGANYKMNDDWQFRGGYAFFQRTIPSDTFTPDIPDSAIHMFTVGLTRSWNPWILDFAFFAFVYADRTITNTQGNTSGASVNGTYKTFIPSVALSLTYKFGK